MDFASHLGRNAMDNRRRERKPGIFRSWSDAARKLAIPVAVSVLIVAAVVDWLA